MSGILQISRHFTHINARLSHIGVALQYYLNKFFAQKRIELCIGGTRFHYKGLPPNSATFFAAYYPETFAAG